MPDWTQREGLAGMVHEGTVSVVTGGAGGIGRSLAVALHRKGHRVCLTDLDTDALEEAADRMKLRGDPRLTLRTLDVRNANEWRTCLDEVVDRHGRLDVLFNVAGYMRAQNLLEVEDRDVDQHFAVNACGVAHGTRLAASHMVRQGHGHIVNLASLMGIAPVPGFALYSASKHASRGLSLCAAQELRPLGVHVTVVCPDAVRTRMLDAQLHSDAAAIAFSGPRPLSVHEVVEVLVGRVLEDKPLEVTLAPPRSARVALSKVVAAIPAITVPLGPIFSALGERAQRRQRRLARRHSFPAGASITPSRS